MPQDFYLLKMKQLATKIVFYQIFSWRGFLFGFLFYISVYYLMLFALFHLSGFPMNFPRELQLLPLNSSFSVLWSEGEKKTTNFSFPNLLRFSCSL